MNKKYNEAKESKNTKEIELNTAQKLEILTRDYWNVNREWKTARIIIRTATNDVIIRHSNFTTCVNMAYTISLDYKTMKENNRDLCNGFTKKEVNY